MVNIWISLTLRCRKHAVAVHPSVHWPRLHHFSIFLTLHVFDVALVISPFSNFAHIVIGPEHLVLGCAAAHLALEVVVPTDPLLLSSCTLTGAGLGIGPVVATGRKRLLVKPTDALGWFLSYEFGFGLLSRWVVDSLIILRGMGPCIKCTLKSRVLEVCRDACRLGDVSSGVGRQMGNAVTMENTLVLCFIVCCSVGNNSWVLSCLKLGLVHAVHRWSSLWVEKLDLLRILLILAHRRSILMTDIVVFVLALVIIIIDQMSRLILSFSVIHICFQFLNYQT